MKNISSHYKTTYLALPYSLRGFAGTDACYLYHPKERIYLTVTPVVLDFLKIVAQGHFTLQEIANHLSQRYELTLKEGIKKTEDCINKLKSWSLVKTLSRLDGQKQISIFSAEGPKKALVNLTAKCNFKCIHCSRGEVKQFKELATSQWKEVITQLTNYGMMHIFFTGGEPFLRDDIIFLLKETEKENVAITLFTHGVLLTKRRIQELSTIQNLQIQFSLHDLDPKSFDSFVKYPGAFKKIIRVIQQCTSEGIDVSVSTSFRKETIPMMEKFPPFLLDMRVREWVPSLIMPLGRAFQNWETLRLDDEDFEKFLESYLSLLSVWRNRLEIKGPIDADLFYGDKKDWSSATVSFGCNFYQQYINIEPDGWITPCDRMTNFKLGNVALEPLESILSKEQIKREHQKQLQQMLKECGAFLSCRECRFAKLCGSGCPSILLQGKKLRESYHDPLLCRMFKEHSPVLLAHASRETRSHLFKAIK